jgi:hypothetical protein
MIQHGSELVSKRVSRQVSERISGWVSERVGQNASDQGIEKASAYTSFTPPKVDEARPFSPRGLCDRVCRSLEGTQNSDGAIVYIEIGPMFAFARCSANHRTKAYLRHAASSLSWSSCRATHIALSGDRKTCYARDKYILMNVLTLGLQCLWRFIERARQGSGTES